MDKCSLIFSIFLVCLLPALSQSTWHQDTWTTFKSLFGNQKGSHSHTEDGIAKEQDVEKDRDDTKLENELPNAEAQIGKVFTFNVPEHIFPGVSQFMVNEAGSTDLPKWLYFDAQRRSFKGLPTALDQGIVYIEITGINNDKTKKKEKLLKEFYIKVSSDTVQSKYDNFNSKADKEQWPDYLLSSSRRSNVKSMEQSHGCDYFDSVWKATLVLDVTIRKILAQERVQLLQDFAQFLGRDIQKLTLGPKRSSSVAHLLDTNVVLAGPGIVNQTSENVGAEISWVIGCGDNVEPKDFARVMEHNMDSELMHNVLKYPVIGWHVSESKSNFLKRKRRQAGFRTPVPTPVLSTGLPTARTTSTTVIQSSSQVVKTSSKTLQSSSVDIVPTRTVPIVESTIFPSKTQTPVISTLPAPESLSTIISATHASNISEVYTSSLNISDILSSPSQSIFMSSVPVSNTSVLHTVNITEILNMSMSSVVNFTGSSELYSIINSSVIETGEILSSKFEMNSSFIMNMTMTASVPELNFTSSDYQSLTSIIVLNSTIEPSSTMDSYATSTLSFADNSSDFFLESSITDENSNFDIYATDTLVTEHLSSLDSVLLSALDETTLLFSSTQLYESTVDMVNVSYLPPLSPSIMSITSPSTSLYSSFGETSPSVADDTPSIDMTLFTQEVSTAIITSPIAGTEIGNSQVLSSSFQPETEIMLDSVYSVPFQTILYSVDTVSNSSMRFQQSTETFTLASDITKLYSLGDSITPFQSIVNEISSFQVISDQSEYLLSSVHSDFSSSVIEPSGSESLQQKITPIDSASSVVLSSVVVETTELESSQQTIQHTVAPTSGLIASSMDISYSDTFSMTTSSLLLETSFVPKTTLTLSEDMSRIFIDSSVMETFLSVGNSDKLTVIDSTLELATSEFPSSYLISRSQELSTEAISFPTSLSSYDLMTTYETFSTSNLILNTSSALGTQATIIPSSSLVPSIVSTETIMQETTSILSTKENSFLSSIEPTTRLQTEVSIPIFVSTMVVTEPLRTPVFPMETSVVELSSVETSSDSMSMTILPSSSIIETFATTLFSSPSVTTSVISVDTSVLQSSPVTSPGVSMSVELSTTAIPNNGPILANPIDKVITKVGQAFELQVPADTFYDYEDGNTKNLNLSLVDLQGQTLPSKSSILFDSKTQTIYGIPLLKDIGSSTAEYVLVATDSNGLSARDVFEVVIMTSSLKDVSQMFRLELNLDYDKFVERTQNTLDLVMAIGNFHGGQKEGAIAVSDLSPGSLVLEYTNTTLSKTECENETILALLETMTKDGKVTPAFEEAMAAIPGSEKPAVRNVTLELLGVCASGNETVAPPVPGPVVGGTVTWLAILITLLVLILLIVLIICLYCYCHRRKRDGDSELIDSEKLIYAKNRKPVLLESEMEMSDVGRKPKKPIIMDTDYGLYPENFGTPRGYIDPPPYRNSGPRGYDNPAYLPDTRTPPPSYGGPSSRSSTPAPPAYRLPPPYVAFPGQSDV